MALRGGIPSKDRELEHLVKDEFERMQAMGGDGVMGRDAGKMRSHEITNDLKKTGKKLYLIWQVVRSQWLFLGTVSFERESA